MLTQEILRFVRHSVTKRPYAAASDQSASGSSLIRYAGGCYAGGGWLQWRKAWRTAARLDGSDDTCGRRTSLGGRAGRVCAESAQCAGASVNGRDRGEISVGDLGPGQRPRRRSTRVF